MTNFNVLEISHVPMTHIKPACLKIYSPRFRQFVIVSKESEEYDECMDNTEIAAKFLSKLNFNIIGQGEGKGKMYIISDTFKPLY
jgi:hypothetical protein